MNNIPAGILAQAAGGPAAALASGKEAEAAAKDFEGILLNKMLEEMERTISRSGLLDSGISKQVQSMFWFYLSQDLARKGGIGLWQDLQGQVGRYQAAAQDVVTPKVEHRS